MKRCIIVGAGASGLVAAIEAARGGASVVVIDANSKPGRKILATGNGRCNLTNTALLPQHFHSTSPLFIDPFLRQFDFATCERYFKSLGLEVIAEEGGKCFPMALQARSVVDALVFTCKALGVAFCCDETVEYIAKTAKGFKVTTSQREHIGDAVLIATGGKAAPKLGANASGLAFATSFGHAITPTFPSLVQLVTHTPPLLASGVKWKSKLTLFVQGAPQATHQGDLLFTQYGLSGSAILDVSRAAIAGLLNEECVEVEVNLFPNHTKEALRGFLTKRLQYAPALPLGQWLEGMLPHKLVKLVLEKAKMDATAPVSKKTVNALTHSLQNLRFGIAGHKGFESAEVMAGGVVLQEIDPKTMESRLEKGLYFSGEVLDVDGDCGGYNLHFAWGSGILAGKAMAR